FTYTVSDPDTATATATVVVTVTPVNDPPPPFLLLSPGHNTRIEITAENLGDSLFILWEGVPDVDGDILTYYLEATPGLATVLAAAPTTTVGLSYRYEDLALAMASLGQTVVSGDWTIKATDGQDTLEALGEPFTLTLDTGTLILKTLLALPEAFALQPNYPNPFNPSTILPFALPQATQVSIVVVDLLGREIRRLVAGPLPAGYHRAVWDGMTSSGEPAPSGVYIALMRAPGFLQSVKLVLLR
ncbi:MAG: hypothetical protein IID14_05370, partial [Candidatus Marinimicrobia bacterium]|nr:hypothetical protein [Candidatus Neomarinimicrobiota bacterium]